MKTIHKITMTAMILILAVGTSLAQNPGKSPGKGTKWVLLGKRVVNYAVDHDEIPVGAGLGDFKAIKIKVTKAALNMHRCVIHYKNGTKQEVELKNNFTPGSESRVIDLVGNERIITHISFWYDTKNKSQQKAVVTVVGLK
ncbi:MAG: hypothetical protein V2A54_08235 [Bacteroidota bacterium]